MGRLDGLISLAVVLKLRASSKINDRRLGDSYARGTGETTFQKALQCERRKNAQVMALLIASVALPKPSGFGARALSINPGIVSH